MSWEGRASCASTVSPALAFAAGDTRRGERLAAATNQPRAAACCFLHLYTLLMDEDTSRRDGPVVETVPLQEALAEADALCEAMLG